MTFLNLQLKALRYPHPVDLSSVESARKLVIWLENQKIREYKIEERKALLDVHSPKWGAAFQKYLQDLECPIPANDLSAALHWLVAKATSLEYEDNADKLVAGGPPGRTPEASPGSGRAPAPSSSSCPPPYSASNRGEDEVVFTDLHEPRVVAAVVQLVAAAGVGTSGAGYGPGSRSGDGGPGEGTSAGSPSSLSLVQQLRAAAQRCVCEMGPAVGGTGGVWSAGRPPSQALERVPLGFEVDGEALRTAAAALRMLYIRDLRRLQSQIDHAIVEMQEYTANPKTDSSLGKVGR